MRKLIATIPLAVVLLATPAGSAAAPEPPAYVPGELLVGLASGKERVLTLPESVGVGEAASALLENPRVTYAVPNYIAHASAVPNDPGFGAPGDWQRTQWNFLPCGHSCGQSATKLPFEARGGINAPGAWDVLKARRAAGGKGAKVAVLDTGVAYRSQRPRFLRSPDFAPKQFLPGYDFVKNNDRPLDRDGHGTHVTGTIAERAGNGIALTGLAPKAKIIPVRVLDSQGLGTARDISKGIRWAAKHGADVINMSFEFSLAVNSCSRIKSVCSAIKFASKRGALVVGAAGNSNGEPIAFPAAAPHAIGVGRVTKDACLAADSRTGPGLDLMAPGGGLPLTPTCGSNDPIFSRDVPIFQLTFTGGGFREFGYPAIYEGTSMAAAHVSGVAAMVVASRVLGANPSPAAIECQLRGTARFEPGELGQTYDPNLFGSGLVDAAAAVTARSAGC
jgi:serine protease